MNDNYYVYDLISSLKRDIIMERYYPLIDFKEELIEIINRFGVVRKEEISQVVIDEIEKELGKNTSNIFTRYIHIYDFNKAKLRDIKEYTGKKEYDSLSELLRLPGVRLLRAKLYYNSGVTLKVLSKESTENIRAMIYDYIQRNNRTEIVPQPKEVNCHREVAKMILHANK